jgi:hypothetical protein
MRALHLIYLAAVLLLSGCSKPKRPATIASAEGFTKKLIDQLRQSGAIEEKGTGSGPVGNVFTRDFSQLLPAESFPPNHLHEAAKAALVKWGEYETYSTRRLAVGGNRFYLYYGDSRSHAFIDVVAYPEQDKTRVDFHIRVIE